MLKVRKRKDEVYVSEYTKENEEEHIGTITLRNKEDWDRLRLSIDTAFQS